MQEIKRRLLLYFDICECVFPLWLLKKDMFASIRAEIPALKSVLPQSLDNLYAFLSREAQIYPLNM